eukprot:Hpha_TRINITY_DN27007_c0_g1::TRINITY_DN27007_c0_g1_i1::g.33161::m.33161
MRRLSSGGGIQPASGGGLDAASLAATLQHTGLWGDLGGALLELARDGARIDPVATAVALRHSAHVPLAPAVWRHLAAEARSGAGIRVRDFCEALHGLSRKGESPATDDWLAAWAGLLRRGCLDGDRVQGRDVGQALYGLRRQSDSAGARAVIAAVGWLVGGREVRMSEQDLSMALYGRCGSSATLEARLLLISLAPTLRAARCELAGQSVAMSLYGFRGQSGAESIEALAALVPLIKNCAGRMHPREVQQALFGLQRLRGDEVDRVLEALYPLIVPGCEFQSRDCHYAIFGVGSAGEPTPAGMRILGVLVPLMRGARRVRPDPRSLVAALQGTRHWVSPRAEPLLEALALDAGLCKGFSGDQLAEALAALQLHGRSVGARQVLVALAGHATGCQEGLSARCTARALLGVEGLDGSSREAVMLLDALVPLIHRSTELLTTRDLTVALTGLGRVGDSPAGRRILGALARRSRVSTDGWSFRSVGRFRQISAALLPNVAGARPLNAFGDASDQTSSR